MSKLKDLTGLTFGRLIVLERAENKGGRAAWLVRCSCGNTKIVLGKNLLNGTCKSCGCLHKEELSKRKTKDLTGKRFGRLTVIERAGSTKHGSSRWLCKCDCGCTKVFTSDALSQGKVKSCGCLHREELSTRNHKHGLVDTRCYGVWCSMKDRCYNENNSSYKNYGGRGIAICDEWKDDPVAFYEWAINNGYNDNLTIERINVNGNYCPENCTWITKEEQARNTRRTHWITFNGETKTISEWSRYIGGESHLVGKRLAKGWTIEKALTTPPRGR